MAGEIELKGTLRIKSKTAAAWSAANPVLAADEPAYETDTGKVKIGDGGNTLEGIAVYDRPDRDIGPTTNPVPCMESD